MPTYNHCPPSTTEYCYNGGDCYYLSEDPSVYICSCFMPYYGPQCEHKAPSPQDLFVKSNASRLEDAENAVRRSVDRAMTITALVFIVVTFLGLLTLAWYLSRRRKLDYAQWKKIRQPSSVLEAKPTRDQAVQVTVECAHEQINPLYHSQQSILIDETEGYKKKPKSNKSRPANQPSSGPSSPGSAGTTSQKFEGFALMPSSDKRQPVHENGDLNVQKQEEEVVDDEEAPSVKSDTTKTPKERWQNESFEATADDREVEALVTDSLRIDNTEKKSQFHNRGGLKKQSGGMAQRKSDYPSRETLPHRDRPFESDVSDAVDLPSVSPHVEQQIHQQSGNKTSPSESEQISPLRNCYSTSPTNKSSEYADPPDIGQRPYVNAREVRDLVETARRPQSAAFVNFNADDGIPTHFHTMQPFGQSLERTGRSRGGRKSTSPRYNQTDTTDPLSNAIKEPFVVASQHDALLSELYHRGGENQMNVRGNPATLPR